MTISKIIGRCSNHLTLGEDLKKGLQTCGLLGILKFATTNSKCADKGSCLKGSHLALQQRVFPPCVTMSARAALSSKNHCRRASVAAEGR